LTLITLEDIRNTVGELAAQFGVPAKDLPTYGSPEGSARPHIEVSGAEMHWVVSERGNEWERRSTDDIDELLFWIFESATWSMAADYELHHRIEDQDFRRVLFAKHLELMGAMRPAWRERRAQRLGSLLREVGLSAELED
jgi:hypothetical protein